MKHKALNQLLCAALINQSFRETLLRNPAQAIDRGYHGQAFPVSVEERALLLKTRVETLEDLAAEVHAWISGNGHHERSHGSEGLIRQGRKGHASRADVLSRYVGKERAAWNGLYRRKSGESASVTSRQPVLDRHEPVFA